MPLIIHNLTHVIITHNILRTILKNIYCNLRKGYLYFSETFIVTFEHKCRIIK